MKQKNLNKKLFLKKSKISNLNINQMRKVIGAIGNTKTTDDGSEVTTEMTTTTSDFTIINPPPLPTTPVE